MHLQITEKTKKWLGVTTTYFTTKQTAYEWHVNITTINRKKFVVLMHDITKFCVVLYGIKPREINDPQFLRLAIVLAMRIEGYNEEHIENYIVNVPKIITYRPTANRRIMGIFNRRLADILRIAEHVGIDFEHPFQLHLSKEINGWIVDILNKEGYTMPHEKMADYLLTLTYS